VTKAGVKFMVDFHCRWYPPLVVARNDIENGVIGDIVSAYLRHNNTLYVPLKMLSWSARSSILWFLGSHTVDALRFLLRDEVARVYSVSRICRMGCLPSVIHSGARRRSQLFQRRIR
jgi:predicted dehydrogenase